MDWLGHCEEVVLGEGVSGLVLEAPTLLVGRTTSEFSGLRKRDAHEIVFWFQRPEMAIPTLDVCSIWRILTGIFSPPFVVA